jgi:predicted amidohydrolase YtcJ
MAGDKHEKHEGTGVSRRALLKTGAITGAAASVAAAGSMALTGTAEAATNSAGNRTSPSEDLILRNGRIHTMDGSGTVASVLAIRGGFVAYVGDSVTAAQRQFAGQPQVIDLHGRMAVPGLIDCHNHFVLMGNRPGHHTPLENASSIADVLALYAIRAATLPANPKPPASADNFITTIGGFSPNQFKEVRLPTLAELDAAVPHQPVFMMVGFTGPAVTNSLGKVFFDNVTGPYPVAVGADGSIAASPFEGDGPATAALLALRQTLTLDDRKRSVRDAMAYSASVGVTTHLDQGAFQATNTPADGSAHDNNYTMYNSFLSVYEEGNQRDADNEQQGIVRLRTNYLLFDTETTIPVATARLQNFQTEIQGYEAVNEQVPITDFRWVVAHVPFITADYVARLKALGGGVNLTSYEYFEAVSPAGPPYRMLLDSGIPVGLSSDGMQIAPLNPWIHAYYATTGVNALGDQVNPGQQLTRMEVLEHFTRANRWFLGGVDEDLLGTLEVGRLGDVVVLNDDYFAVSDEDLKKLHSVLTVLGGKVVHSGGIDYWA